MICYHRRMDLRFFAGSGMLLLACGCPGGKGYAPPWTQAPTAAQEAAKLDAAGKAITSFRAESVMDYWLGKDRVKGTVMVMGKPGAFVRLNALSPAGDSVIADLACDGRDFVMVDFQNNCVLTGPCDETSIAQFLHVALSPDDFLHLATGTTPIVAGPDGTVTWDASAGHEQLVLTKGDVTQSIEIDGRDGHTDVLKSQVKGGGLDWTIENKDFAPVAGTAFRIPAKSRFQSAGQKADLLVEWNEVKLNVDLPPAKFQLTPPPGLPTCGAQGPSMKPIDGPAPQQGVTRP
jgi:outer membrane lipoprotein-sorting protein